jgi:hypothetical protein
METIEAIIRAAFPEHPIPKAFFGSPEGLGYDLPQELALRIEGRAWTSLSFLDWRMVGAAPAAYREYVVPKTFAYYVPSFLVGVVSEPEFRDLAFEAILPNNREHRPRGEWWMSFAAAFTDPQRAAMKAFLVFQREAARTFDMVDEELASAAENIWARAPPLLQRCALNHPVASARACSWPVSPG